MRCRTSERWISDGIDGCLSVRKSARLEAHLASCAACREIRRRFLRLAERSVPPGFAVPPGYWEDSLSRLRAKLESSGPALPTKAPVLRPAFFPAARWAWAGAATLLAAAAGLLILTSRRGGPIEAFPLTSEEATTSLVAMIGNDQELESDFVELIQASIREHADVQDGDVRRLIYGKSHFLDGLSEDELQTLDDHIARELKI
jgi:hypothetical protein